MPKQNDARVDGRFVHARFSSSYNPELEHSASDLSSVDEPANTTDIGDSNYPTDAGCVYQLVQHYDWPQQQQQTHGDLTQRMWGQVNHHNNDPVHASALPPQIISTACPRAQEFGLQLPDRSSHFNQPHPIQTYVKYAGQQERRTQQASSELILSPV